MSKIGLPLADMMNKSKWNNERACGRRLNQPGEVLAWEWVDKDKARGEEKRQKGDLIILFFNFSSSFSVDSKALCLAESAACFSLEEAERGILDLGNLSADLVSDGGFADLSLRGIADLLIRVEAFSFQVAWSWSISSSVTTHVHQIKET